MDHILSMYPFAEISFLGDFNVHHQLLVFSPITNHPGELAFNFGILHDLEQLVQCPDRIPDRLGVLSRLCQFFSFPSSVNSVWSPLRMYGEVQLTQSY